MIVSDTSPMIFLCRLGQLPLLQSLFPSGIAVPQQVKRELLHPGARSEEAAILSKYLQTCEVVSVPRPKVFSTALSAADNAVLTLAIRKKASCILADERLLRRIALLEGIRVKGTIGILSSSLEKGLIRAEEARMLLRRLVRDGGFRISIDVFERAMEAFNDSCTSSKCGKDPHSA